ncbi:hypothetical protein [Flavobacterium sp.]
MFFLFFLFVPTHAQQDAELVSIKSILEEISQLNHVQFSYIEEELIIFKIKPPKKSLKLAEKIAYIASATGLRIKKVSNDYYSVSNDSKLDKPLCAYLWDADTGYPIENATIKISNTNVIVFSNEKGYFELPLVSPNPIEVTHMSYQKKTMLPSEYILQNVLK